MKIRIEVEDALPEDEIVIRCRRVDEGIQRIHQFILEQNSTAAQIVFFKDGQQFFFPPGDILFFETEGEDVFAHTETTAYRIRYRLYELEEILPRQFMRASKSCIVNLQKIYSIKRDLTASSLVQFMGTHKQIYISRRYYSALKTRMQEGRV